MTPSETIPQFVSPGAGAPGKIVPLVLKALATRASERMRAESCGAPPPAAGLTFHEMNVATSRFLGPNRELSDRQVRNAIYHLSAKGIVAPVQEAGRRNVRWALASPVRLISMALHGGLRVHRSTPAPTPEPTLPVEHSQRRLSA